MFLCLVRSMKKRKQNTEFVEKLTERGEIALMEGWASPEELKEFKERMEAFKVSYGPCSFRRRSPSVCTVREQERATLYIYPHGTRYTTPRSLPRAGAVLLRPPLCRVGQVLKVDESLTISSVAVRKTSG